MIKELKPVPLRTEYWERVEAEMLLQLRKLVYLPLMREIEAPPLLLTNSIEHLVDAIIAGRVQFVRGHFEGAFTAQISKALKALGATWNTGKAWWVLPHKELPADVRTAIAAYYSRVQAQATRLERRLTAVSADQVSAAMRLEKIIDTAVWQADTDFHSCVKAVGVPPSLTAAEKSRMAAEYTDTIHLKIRDWTQQETQELRAKVAAHALHGGRYDALVQTIQDSYGATQNRARFLARQETSLLMTKFRQVRFESAGIPEYRWKCVHNAKDTSPHHHTPGNVRYYHGLLDGKILRWDTGGVINAHGQKKNPGQDYWCRCTGIPIVRY